MAGTSTIQFLHGLSTSAAWPTLTLLVGEPAFLTDTGKLYIGNGTSKILINPTYGTAANADTGTSPGNVPILDGGGKLNPSVIPASFVNTVFVVATVADLVTLTTAQIGDVAIVTSTSESYILKTLPPTVAGNWVKLLFNNSVLSVNGMTGVVTVNGSNINLTGYTGTQTGAITAADTVNAAIAKIANSLSGYLNLTTGGTVTGTTNFTGSLTAVTQPSGTNNTTVATTAFVKDAISSFAAPVTSVNTKTGAVVLGASDILNTGYTIATSFSQVTAADSVATAFGKLQYQTLHIDGGTF